MSDSIQFDPNDTVRVGARRFEHSPFRHLWETPETLMGVYAGRFYAKNIGEDVESCYWNLRRKAMLYDVPERPVEISGPDVVPFLERIFTRRVGDLRLGRGRYAIACAHHGGLFIDGVLFRLDENRFWYVQPDGALETWLLAHAESFDVTVSDPKSRVLQVQGPTSFAILQDLTEGAITEKMGYFHSGFFTIAGQEVYVSRTGWTGEIGYEIYTQANTNADMLWKRVMSAGMPHGMRFGSVASMGIRRIEAGILDSGSDFDLTTNPWEAGLGAFVDLDAQDFIGRKALLTAPRGRRLFGLTCPEAPRDGHLILDGVEVVGHVTAGAKSPFLDTGIGYARMATAGDWSGHHLLLRSDTGTEMPCKITDLPFYDADKRIPRGLDRTIP
ncbi:MAG: aminomethyltransferase family protein [Parvibaculaceae bacterium]